MLRRDTQPVSPKVWCISFPAFGALGCAAVCALNLINPLVADRAATFGLIDQPE